MLYHWLSKKLLWPWKIKSPLSMLYTHLYVITSSCANWSAHEFALALYCVWNSSAQPLDWDAEPCFTWLSSIISSPRLIFETNWKNLEFFPKWEKRGYCQALTTGWSKWPYKLNIRLVSISLFDTRSWIKSILNNGSDMTSNSEQPIQKHNIPSLHIQQGPPLGHSWKQDYI